MPDTLHCKTVSKIRMQPPGTYQAPFFLNALDHFQAWFLVEAVYFYDSVLDPARLQSSLQQTLREFSPLCGQLNTEPGGRLFISHPHAGPLFTVSDCDRSMAEITAGLHEKWQVYDFIEKINPLLLLLRNRPLATFKITRMKCGGSALGISMSHALADAYSFYYFIRRWSQVHEGQAAESPLHDRSLLLFSEQSAGGSLRRADGTSQSCRGFRLLSAWQLFRLISNFLLQQRSVVCRVLRFNSSQVQALKAAAECRGPVSLNDALSAHLWQFCTKLRGAGHNSAPCKLLIPANMRFSIDHPLAAHYFGNAISHVTVPGAQAGLANADVASLAATCRQHVAALDKDHVREQMQWLSRIERGKKLYRVYADIDPYAGGCMISNLYRLPVYEAQFDGVKPSQAHVPVIPIPWVLQIFPAPGENKGVDVYAHIPRPAADQLKLAEWQKELYKYA